MLKIDNPGQLTSLEIEILQLLAECRSNKHIAGELYITMRTVKFHTSNIYAKLVVNSRAEAIAWVWKNRGIQNSLQD